MLKNATMAPRADQATSDPDLEDSAIDSSEATFTPSSSTMSSTQLPLPSHTETSSDIDPGNTESPYDLEQHDQQTTITAKLLLLQFFVAMYSIFNWLTHFHLSPKSINTLCEEGSFLISMANLSPAILPMVLLPSIAIFTVEWLRKRASWDDVEWALDYWLVVAGVMVGMHFLAAVTEPDKGMCSRR